MPPSKNWVAQFKRGDFSTCDARRPGRPKKVTTPEIRNVNGASHLSNFWNSFDAILMISCRDCWTWTKPNYITMTRRQSNNKWSAGIAAHPFPKNSECKNPLENFLPRFFGIRTASSSLIIFQRAKTINAEYYSSLLLQLKDILKEKRPGNVITRGLLFARQCPGSPGTCNPQKNWPTWASNALITNYSPNLVPSYYHLFPGLK